MRVVSKESGKGMKIIEMLKKKPIKIKAKPARQPNWDKVA
jgi:hypothetical protein